MLFIIFIVVSSGKVAIGQLIEYQLFGLVDIVCFGLLVPFGVAVSVQILAQQTYFIPDRANL